MASPGRCVLLARRSVMDYLMPQWKLWTAPGRNEIEGRMHAKTQVSVDEAITTRKSVRAFKPDPVPAETIKHILNVAARAPSGTNIQPWKVYALAGAEKERMSAAVLKRREEGPARPEFSYYPKKWFEPYLARRRKVGWDLYGLLGLTREDKAGMWAQFGRNYLFFDAPVGLFFTFHRDLELGTWLDMGMFLQSVMLAARGQGLHTCPQAAWIEYPETVAAVLGLAPEEQLVCGMCLGYEDESAVVNTLVTEREPCESFTTFRGF
jgi:nitroreductase